MRPRKVAPDVTVTDRRTEPQDAMLAGDLEKAQKLIDARLQRGVLDHVSGGVKFKDPSLVGRWWNQAINTQQIYQARQKGWLPATPGMIADLELLGVYTVNDAGHIVRGERGLEHLMFMSQENANRIAQAKTAENARRLGGKAAKDDVATTVGLEHGDQAGEFVDRHVTGEIDDHVERFEAQ